jgi:hypothetical protein
VASRLSEVDAQTRCTTQVIVVLTPALVTSNDSVVSLRSSSPAVEARSPGGFYTTIGRAAPSIERIAPEM